MRKLVSTIFMLGCILMSAQAVFADAPATQPPLTAPVPAPSTTSDRKTSLSFDNAVVEGMNANSMDSAENIGANDGVAQHLYRVRKDFNDQTPMLIHEMGFSE